MARTVFGVPLYEKAAHLPQALETLLGQRERDLALVLVDDASRDTTAQIAARYAELDARVTLVRNPERLGLVGSWRRALELARERHLALTNRLVALPNGVDGCCNRRRGKNGQARDNHTLQKCGALELSNILAVELVLRCPVERGSEVEQATVGLTRDILAPEGGTLLAHLEAARPATA